MNYNYKNIKIQTQTTMSDSDSDYEYWNWQKESWEQEDWEEKLTRQELANAKNKPTQRFLHEQAHAAADALRNERLKRQSLRKQGSQGSDNSQARKPKYNSRYHKNRTLVEDVSVC